MFLIFRDIDISLSIGRFFYCVYVCDKNAFIYGSGWNRYQLSIN